MFVTESDRTGNGHNADIRDGNSAKLNDQKNIDESKQ